MRNVVASAMVVTMALCLLAGVVCFGAVSVNLAAPVYVFALVAGLIWAGKLFFMNVVSWKPSPMHWPVLAFAFYALMRYLVSPIEYESRMELFRVWLLAFVYFLCAFNFYRSRDRTIIFTVLLALAFAESLYGLWQFGTRSNDVLHLSRPTAYEGRASGTYICPNHLAGLLEMVIALAVGRTVTRRFSRTSVEKSALRKILVVYVTLFLIAGMIVTFSRAGWSALVVALATLLLWGSWDWRVLWPRLLAGGVAILVVIVVGWNIKPVRIYVQDTLSGEQKKDGSALRDPSLGGRTLMWRATTGMIQERPLLGSGPGTWQYLHLKHRPPESQIHADFAHNDILQLAAEYGVIGFGIVVWAFAAFFWHAWRVVRHNSSSEQRAFAVGSALAVTAIIVHSWFDFNMHILGNALLLVTLMGVTVAMDEDEENKQRVELKGARYALGAAILVLCGLGAWFVTPAVMAHHYQDRAEDLQSSLDWDGTVAACKKASTWDRNFPEPYRIRGEIYYATSRWKVDEDQEKERKEFAEGAVWAFNKSLKRNPFQGLVLVRLANAYELAGDFENAAKCLTQALALEPHSAFFYEEMGLFYRRRGDEPRALACFEKSRSIHATFLADLNVWELKANP
jgi:putative inorganic carbon (HCO3(-)) transporter